jgi:[ribosomal protein S5]-alanine N-acetyltransferase
MQFEPASDEHNRVFVQWSQLSRLQERTCRPILNGKRVPPCSDVITLTFSVDGVSELVGRFQYFDFNVRNQSAEFGYMVNPKFRQKGMGTKMLAAAITHLFSTTNLNKLYCQTAAFNVASTKLLEKLSLQREGILREHHELDGKLWDDYIYSILRCEWKEIERHKNKFS